jgi:hypothetical protein
VRFAFNVPDFVDPHLLVEMARETETMVGGSAEPGEVAAFADAGAIWWSESYVPWQMSPESARNRVRLGPPALRAGA